jgi:hypothetical protein
VFFPRRERLGRRLKPRVPGARSTTSRSHPPCAWHQAASSCPRVRSISPHLCKAWEEWSKSSKQVTSPFPIVQIGRRDIHGQEKAERIHKHMAFAPFDACMGIKSADSSGFLDRFHADVASMMAALGWAFLPCRSRSVTRLVVSRRAPGVGHRANGENGRTQFAKGESSRVGSATGRKSRRT